MGKQPASGGKKTKEAIAKAASAASKGIKKKWVKGKDRDQLNLAVFYDKDAFAKLEKDVPVMKLITVATVSDRLKVNGSLARLGIRYLAGKKLIKPCGQQHAKMVVYTGTREVKAAEATGKEGQADKKGAKKGGKQAAAKEEAVAAEP